MMQLRIGVTGHRILTDTDRIRKGVDHALQHVAKTFHPESLMVLSCLAEGGDSIVTEQAIFGFHARLCAVLPLSSKEYLNDFQTEESGNRFLSLLEKAEQIIEIPQTESRDESYLAAGRYVLDHSDVLVVIWDGEEAQGKGGTGEIVSEARKRGIAIAWIRAGNRRPGTREPTSHPDQGKVTFENFPDRSLQN